MSAHKLSKLELAALHWWRSLRPVEWSQRAHIDCPQVNTTTPAESRLAMEAAKVAAARVARRGKP